MSVTRTVDRPHEDRSAAALDPAALVAELAAFPGELGRAMADRSDETLTRPASDGGWGVVENVCHLRDWEEVFLDRVRAVIERDDAELPAFDDELWAIEHDYRGDDPRRALATFQDHRRKVVRLLEELPQERWARRARHEVQGELTLRRLVEQMLRHDDEHLAQIREALA